MQAGHSQGLDVYVPPSMGLSLGDVNGQQQLQNFLTQTPPQAMTHGQVLQLLQLQAIVQQTNGQSGLAPGQSLSGVAMHGLSNVSVCKAAAAGSADACGHRVSLAAVEPSILWQSAARPSCMCSGSALSPDGKLGAVLALAWLTFLHIQTAMKSRLERAGMLEAIQQAIQLAQQAQGIHEQGQLQQPAPEAEAEPQDNHLGPEQAPAIAASPPEAALPIAEQQPEVGRHWLPRYLCSAWRHLADFCRGRAVVLAAGLCFAAYQGSKSMEQSAPAPFDSSHHQISC